MEFNVRDEHYGVGIQTDFQRLALQMQDILGGGGILKEVVQAGDGPCIPRDASVCIHFSGFLENSAQPFESTRHLKFPKMMKLGRDMTLFGLELGLLTMRKGEISHFLLQPQFAYGRMGCPPLIPPMATVLFRVQVLDFFDSAQVDDFFAMTLEKQNLAPLASLLSIAQTERSFGNRCYYQSRYEDARDHYKRAMALLRNRETLDEDEKKVVEGAMLPVLLNISVTYRRLEKHHKALKYSQRALQISPDNTKALFYCGQACLVIKEYEKAQEYLTKAQARKPFDADINNLSQKLAVTTRIKRRTCAPGCFPLPRITSEMFYNSEQLKEAA